MAWRCVAQFTPPLNLLLHYYHEHCSSVPPVPPVPKSRLAYILLALFLGGFGIHNFYAGYTGKGVAQLVLTLLGFVVGVTFLVVLVWVLIEICTVTKDAQGVPFGS